MWKAARLASQLPPEGAVGRAGRTEGYTITDYLLLTVIDCLQAANWQRANAGLPRGRQTSPPKPVPRPGEKPRRKISMDDLLAHKRRTQRR